MCHAGVTMRDPEIIETELMEISAIADESIKLERIIAWCASYPDEVPFALHQLMRRRDKHSRNLDDLAAGNGRRVVARQLESSICPCAWKRRLSQKAHYSQ